MLLNKKYLLFLFLSAVACSETETANEPKTPTETPPTSEDDEIASLLPPGAPGWVRAKLSQSQALVNDMVSCQVEMEDIAERIVVQKGYDEKTYPYTYVVSTSYKWFEANNENGPYSIIGGQSLDNIKIGKEFSHKFLRCSGDIKVIWEPKTPSADVSSGPVGGSLSVLSDPSPMLHVANSAPIPFSSFISSTSYVFNDQVRCSGSTGDIDGDAVTYNYRILKVKRLRSNYLVETGASTPVFSTIASDEVIPASGWLTPTDNFTVDTSLSGHFIFCQIRAADSLSRFTFSQSSAAAVQNILPQAFSSLVINLGGGAREDLGIAPVTQTSFRVGDRLSCLGTTRDPEDGSLLSYQYIWEKQNNGVVNVSPFSSSSYTVLPEDAHGEIRCVIKATDKLGGATNSFAQFRPIENTPPLSFTSVTSFSLSTVGTEIRCIGLGRDVDIDQLNLSYEWSASSQAALTGDWVPFSGLLSANAITVPREAARKYLKCNIYASDGYGGAVVSSSTAVAFIENTRPAFFTAQASPQSATLGSSFNCEGSSTDTEDSSLSYGYRWVRSSSLNGTYAYISPQDGGTGKIIQPSLSMAHSYLKCEILASDGFGGETLSDRSQAVEISNTLPADFSASLSTLNLTVGDTLNCLGSTTDLDADTLTYRADFFAAPSSEYLNVFPSAPGEEVTYSSQSTSLSITREMAHRVIRCELVANDGMGVRRSSSSGLATVENLPPESFVATLSSTGLKTGGSLSCAGRTSDSDGDNLLYDVEFLYSDTQDGMASIWHVSFNLDPDGLENALSEKEIVSSVARKWVSCSITAKDPFSGVRLASVSESIYVSNTRPADFAADLREENTPINEELFNSESQASLTGEVFVGDALLCRYKTSDIDMDEVRYEVEWYKSATENGPFSEFLPYTPGLNHSPPDPSPLIQNSTFITSDRQRMVARVDEAHSYIYCQTRAFDDFGGSIYSPPSRTVKISNSPPNNFSPELKKINGGVFSIASSAVVGETLRCEEDRTLSDPDEDNLSVNYIWSFFPYNETTGLLYASPIVLGFASNNRDLVISYEYSHGALSCQIRVFDGFDQPQEPRRGEIVSAPSNLVVIENSQPTQASATIVSISNSVNGLGEYSYSTTSFEIDERIACIGSGVDPDQDTLSVKETRWFHAPFLSIDGNGAVSYGPNVLIGTDNIEKTNLGTMTNNPVFSGILTHILQTGQDEKHGKISCQIIIEDVFGGERLSSASGQLLYSNAVPAPFLAQLNIVSQPNEASRFIPNASLLYSGTQINCTGTTTDQDSDNILYTTRLESSSNGTDWTIETGELPRVVSPLLSRKSLRCSVTASDERGGVRVSSYSEEMFVNQSNPVFTVFPVGPVNIAEGQAAQYNVRAYDPDNDPLLFTCQNCTSGLSVPSEIQVQVDVGVTGTIYGRYNEIGWSIVVSPGYNHATTVSPVRNYNYVFAATGGNSGGVISQGLSINVNNTDRPPQLTLYCPSQTSETNPASTPSVNVNSSHKIEVSYDLTDPDGDLATVSGVSGFNPKAQGTTTVSSGTASNGKPSYFMPGDFRYVQRRYYCVDSEDNEGNGVWNSHCIQWSCPANFSMDPAKSSWESDACYGTSNTSQKAAAIGGSEIYGSLRTQNVNENWNVSITASNAGGTNPVTRSCQISVSNVDRVAYATTKSMTLPASNPYCHNTSWNNTARYDGTSMQSYQNFIYSAFAVGDYDVEDETYVQPEVSSNRTCSVGSAGITDSQRISLMDYLWRDYSNGSIGIWYRPYNQYSTERGPAAKLTVRGCLFRSQAKQNNEAYINVGFDSNNLVYRSRTVFLHHNPPSSTSSLWAHSCTGTPMPFQDSYMFSSGSGYGCSTVDSRNSSGLVVARLCSCTDTLGLLNASASTICSWANQVNSY